MIWPQEVMDRALALFAKHEAALEARDRERDLLTVTPENCKEFARVGLRIENCERYPLIGHRFKVRMTPEMAKDWGFE